MLYSRICTRFGLGGLATIILLSTGCDSAERLVQVAEEPPLAPTLTVTDLGATYRRDSTRTPDALFFDSANKGGSTSIRAEDALHLDWKTSGYYQRNRELGQVFNVPAGEDVTLDALVLRTGNSATAVLAGTAGAPLFIQFFEVSGTPRINDNGTPVGTDATHGFTTNHRADDYIDGVTYRPLLVAEGGTFPDIAATTKTGGEPGHLRYLRFDLGGAAELTLEGGRRYAFVVGFAEEGQEFGFTLGNDNLAAEGAAPVLRTDASGRAWWGLRREGAGGIPTQIPGESPPLDTALDASLKRESRFAPGYRTELMPTTNGFPDVDTYRVVEFYVEVK